MTILAPLFNRSSATTLTVWDDILSSSRLLSDFASMTGAIALDNDYLASYEEIAKKQLWVRIAVNKLAYTIGRLPLKTYERGDDNDRRRATDSPLAQLLRRPNGTKETGNPAGFKARVAYDLFVYSNAIIVKGQTRPDRVPFELMPFAPRGWHIDGDTYVYRDMKTGEERSFPSWRVIHIAEPGPTTQGFGVSRLEAARLTLAIEFAAQRLGVATFQNGARPSSIINVKSGLPTNNEQRAASIERFKSEVQRRFGGVNKAGLPAVLEGDVDWKTVAHNLADSAVVEHRQLTREEVAALYDIPQPGIGILDEANFASIDILHIMLYQDTMGWPIKLIEDALQHQLLEGIPELADQYVEFDMNAVMRGALLQRMQAYQTAINASIMTPDEARALENWPAMADQQEEAGMLRFPLNYGVSSEPAGLEGP